MREWRGLGEPGEPWDDKGVVLPEALAWTKAIEEKEERERVAKKKRVNAEYAALAAAARFDPPERVCAATGVVTGDLRRCAVAIALLLEPRGPEGALALPQAYLQGGDERGDHRDTAAPLADAVARLKISLSRRRPPRELRPPRRTRLTSPTTKTSASSMTCINRPEPHLRWQRRPGDLAAPGMAAAMLHGDRLVNADAYSRHGFGGAAARDSLPDIRDATARRAAGPGTGGHFDDDMSDRRGAFTSAPSTLTSR